MNSVFERILRFIRFSQTKCHILSDTLVHASKHTHTGAVVTRPIHWMKGETFDFLVEIARNDAKKKKQHTKFVQSKKETKIEKLSFIQDYFYGGQRKLSRP